MKPYVEVAAHGRQVFGPAVDFRRQEDEFQSEKVQNFQRRFEVPTRKIESSVQVLKFEPPKQRVVEVPVQRVAINQVEVPLYRLREREKVLTLKNPVINRRETVYPVETIRSVFAPVEVELESKKHRFSERKIFREVGVPSFVERATEVCREKELPVELLVEIEQTRPIFVEKTTEVALPIEVELQAEVEVLRVKDVLLPVDKVIEVPIEVRVERPVFRLRETEEPLFVELISEEVIGAAGVEYFEERLPDSEREDPLFSQEIKEKEARLESARQKNSRLAQEFRDLAQERDLLVKAVLENSENARLRGQLSAAESNLRSHQLRGKDLSLRAKSRDKSSEIKVVRSPKVSGLKSKLKNLIAENQMLISQIKEKGDRVREESLRKKKPEAL